LYMYLDLQTASNSSKIIRCKPLLSPNCMTEITSERNQNNISPHQQTTDKRPTQDIPQLKWGEKQNEGNE